jgi:hypothetical protein
MMGRGLLRRGGEGLWRSLWGSPALLPATLASAFPELQEARYRVGGIPPKVGGWFLGLSSVAAITLWRTVWLAPGTSMSAELLLHELRHVQQFQTVRGFPVRYIWETVRRGYRRNRFEVEARQFAGARTRSLPNALPFEDE